jgi:hypothetical protein
MVNRAKLIRAKDNRNDIQHAVPVRVRSLSWMTHVDDTFFIVVIP